ncbi:MAG TPA: HDIG domain-containing protein [Spirochaetota bacterium]|nr:HDIG domain-containing protein [Spirochaetota bacterium]HPC42470.1 HDIG domain-containing protein [Spirochaetota bacterium]HPL15073.1 HDIG domain-containing protein [Spirochaetota bacterium]HQF08080.1 HDIG domain-containing protein [Spirochaetota bacterium]HQH97033.1 HDIG domain-containing protein [Spirochaetota bacterium]
MTTHKPTREEAMSLLKEYNKTENLLKHGLAVEAIMRQFAIKYGEDSDTWGIIGLIHDLDYEQFPQEHCTMSQKILKEKGWPEEYIRAVASHGWGMFNDIEPQTLLEKTLYTVDELSGLIIAAALVRPSRSLMDLEASSVKKKWKDKGFAAGVDRAVIEKGAKMLGIDMAEIIKESILGLRTIAGELGLEGNPGSN